MFPLTSIDRQSPAAAGALKGLRIRQRLMSMQRNSNSPGEALFGSRKLFVDQAPKIIRNRRLFEALDHFI